MLSEVEYNHFLLLSVATRICSCNNYKNHLKIASKLFRIYVEQYMEIYGRHSISSNIHNLIHVTEDLEYCGSGNLMEISTYQFENTLRLLGLKLKHSNRPLEQIVCRTIEQNQLQQSKIKFYVHEQFQPEVFYEKQHENHGSVFQKITIAYDTMLSSRKDKDSWFMTKSKEIVKFKYAVKKKNRFKLFGMQIAHEQMKPFFTNGITSTKLDIYTSSNEFENDLQSYDLKSIEAKIMCLTYENQFVFIPLLHTLENLKNK